MQALNWPWWVVLLILGVEAWPVTLGIALCLLVLAMLMHGWVRWTAIAAVLPCLAIIVVAAWWGIEARQSDRRTAAFEARVNQVLDRDEVVNGLHLPAGTAIRWQDVDHVQIGTASPPDPIMLLGLRVRWVQRADNGTDWNLILAEPELVQGWMCEENGVQVSPAGQLRSCRLASGRAWKGWPIPAGSLLELTTAEKVGLVLPTGAGMAAPEIGHDIIDTGIFTLNADGSLDRLYFEMDQPLLVAGQRLWNSVQWTYDAATYGQGRQRRALTIRGTLVSADGVTGGNVIIHLPGGRMTVAD